MKMIAKLEVPRTQILQAGAADGKVSPPRQLRGLHPHAQAAKMTCVKQTLSYL